MAKRKIFLGLNTPLLGQPLPALAAVAAGALLKTTATGYTLSDLADTSTAQELLLAPEVPASEGGTIATTHTIGDTIEPVIVRSGEFANALVASGQNITSVNTALASNGAGALKIAAVDGTDVIVAFADEVINTGGAAALVRVRKS